MTSGVVRVAVRGVRARGLTALLEPAAGPIEQVTATVVPERFRQWAAPLNALQGDEQAAETEKGLAEVIDQSAIGGRDREQRDAPGELIHRL